LLPDRGGPGRQKPRQQPQEIRVSADEEQIRRLHAGRARPRGGERAAGKALTKQLKALGLQVNKAQAVRLIHIPGPPLFPLDSEDLSQLPHAFHELPIAMPATSAEYHTCSPERRQRVALRHALSRLCPDCASTSDYFWRVLREIGRGQAVK